MERFKTSSGNYDTIAQWKRDVDWETEMMEEEESMARMRMASIIRHLLIIGRRAGTESETMNR